MGAGGLLLIGSFFVAMIVINGVCGGGCARVCVCVGASDGRAEPGSQETPLLTSDSCVLVWRRGSEITCVFVTGRSLVCEWHGDGGRDPSPIRPVCFIDYSYTHTLDVQVQDFLLARALEPRSTQLCGTERPRSFTAAAAGTETAAALGCHCSITCVNLKAGQSRTQHRDHVLQFVRSGSTERCGEFSQG